MPYQDGNFPSGCNTVSINGVTYVCNSFNYTKASRKTNVTDGSGDPSGALFHKDFYTGTAELQFSASNIAEPTTAAANSTTGVFVANIEGANANCVIESVTINKQKDAPWTASVTWQRKIN